MSALQFTPYGWPEPGPRYLEPTEYLDFEDPHVRCFTDAALAGVSDPADRAVRLFHAVRDGIRYDPYHVRFAPALFRASSVVQDGRAFCIPKAALLVACARRAGIPAAIGLSDVTNHFNSPRLRDRMGGREVFLHHGWAALHLAGRWVKAVPAFNSELCTKMGVPATEFDGRSDAILQQFDAAGSRTMSYLRDHGIWSDVPYVRIWDDWHGYYPTTLWSTPASTGVDASFEPS